MDLVSERFYSGQRDGQLTVRDGTMGAKRPLELRFDLRKDPAPRLGQAVDSPEHTLLALTLLADALGDEKRAIEMHEYFSHRVIKRFPERWTITRSRILAYVDLSEQEKRAFPERASS